MWAGGLALVFLYQGIKSAAGLAEELQVEAEPYAVVAEGSGAMAMAMLPNGKLLIGTFGNGLHIYDSREDRVDSVLTSGMSVNALLHIESGCTAVAGGGVRLLNLTGSDREAHRRGQRSAVLLQGSAVNAVLEVPIPATGSRAPAPGEIAPVGTGIFVATDAGLHLLREDVLTCGDEPQGLSAMLVATRNASVGLGLEPDVPLAGFLPDRFVYSLAWLPERGLLAAGTDQGISLLIAGNEQPTVMAALGPRVMVTSLLALPDGGLAAGTHGQGVLLFSRDALRPGGRPYTSFAHGRAVWDLLLLPMGELLVGTEGGEGALVFPAEDWNPKGRHRMALAQGSIVWSLELLSSRNGDGILAVGTSEGVFLFSDHAEVPSGSAFL